MSTFTVAVPYHCPKCRAVSLHMTFDSLAELRDHVIKVHFRSGPAESNTAVQDTAALAKKSNSYEDLTSRSIARYDNLLDGSRVDNERIQQKVKDLKKQVEEERSERRRRMKEIEERDQIISGRKQIHIVPSVKDGELDVEEQKLTSIKNVELERLQIDDDDELKELKNKIDNLFRRNKQADMEIQMFEKYKEKNEAAIKLKKVDDVLSSCEVASDMVARYYNATDPNLISKLLAPADSSPNHTVLSQIYVHAFNTYYAKLQH